MKHPEKGSIRIETPRLYLRDTIFEDLKKFSEWEVLPNVTEFLTINEDRDYEEVVTEFIERKDDEDKLDLTLVDKATDEPVGRLFISAINYHYDSLDLSRMYIGDENLRWNGLGTEIFEAVLKYCFTELGCERVTLDHYDGNVRAHNLYIKMGFKPEGCMRHAGKKNGKYENYNLMSILKDEYLSK